MEEQAIMGETPNVPTLWLYMILGSGVVGLAGLLAFVAANATFTPTRIAAEKPHGSGCHSDPPLYCQDYASLNAPNNTLAASQRKGAVWLSEPQLSVTSGLDVGTMASSIKAMPRSHSKAGTSPADSCMTSPFYLYPLSESTSSGNISPVEISSGDTHGGISWSRVTGGQTHFSDLVETKTTDLFARLDASTGAGAQAFPRLCEPMTPKRLSNELLLDRARSRRLSRSFVSMNSNGRPSFSDLPESGGRYEVLSVDDEEVNQDVMLAMLPPDRYVVVKAMDGIEAMELLGSRPHLPDIILLDVMMPEMSGLQVCQAIRKTHSATELPIIMVSGLSSLQDVVAGLDIGANDYLAKPARHVELLSRINTQLAMKRAARMEAEALFQRHLLANMLPPHIIRRLQQGEKLIADDHEEVTILFSDIVGFTEMCAELPTSTIIMMLDEMFTKFDHLSDQCGVYKVETVGDAYMVVAGHDGNENHAEQMLEMASGMLAAANSILTPGSRRPLQIRVGMHSGPAYSGVIGNKCPRYCFFGDTVNTASRMESHGFPNTIHLSVSTFSKLASAQACGRLHTEFVPCGTRHVKGKGAMQTFLVKQGAWQEALQAWGSAGELGTPPPQEVHEDGQDPLQTASSGSV